uniref:IP03252p n=1 Tax=Drosophila melanogaster TaxID=7227 RepID=Q4V421_DROME|nr:IP03552p [Drosophila melanogaster]AAY55601.1 IP03252p [Drosophila melanogaster]
MGNRLSGLWCKKTTLSITQQEEQQYNREIRNEKSPPRSGRKSNRIRTKSSGSGDGRGTFRLASIRRLSLRDNPKKTIKTPLDNPSIATVEQTFRELTKRADLDSSMKVNAQLMPTVKMTDFSDSSPSGVLSPPTSLIENFHKKNSSPQPLGSSSAISTLTPTTLNGSVVGGGVGGAGHHSIENGRQSIPALVHAVVLRKPHTSPHPHHNRLSTAAAAQRRGWRRSLSVCTTT